MFFACGIEVVKEQRLLLLFAFSGELEPVGRKKERKNSKKGLEFASQLLGDNPFCLALPADVLSHFPPLGNSFERVFSECENRTAANWFPSIVC